MHTKKIEQLLMSFLFTGLIFIHIIMSLALAVGPEEMERLCSYLILGMGFLMFGTSFFCNNKLTGRDFLFLLFVIFCMLVGAYRRWEYENVVSASCFLLMMSVWRSAEAMTLSKVMLQRICVIYILQGLVLIGLFFSPYAYESYVDFVEVSRQLTLGYANPNQTGIILLSTVMILLILCDQSFIHKGLKLVIYIESCFLGLLLILTDARTSILGGVVFLIYFVLVIKKKKQIRRNEIFEDVVVCCPILFVPFYLWLSDVLAGQTYRFWGKKLISGRQRVYRRVLNQWWDHALGNLKKFNMQNFHNAHFTVLLNFGVIGFSIYLLFTFAAFCTFRAQCRTPRQFLCMISILVLFFISCAESAVLVNGTIYYIYMLVLLVLGYSVEEQ